MAAPDLKAIIYAKTKNLEICQALNLVMQATDYAGILMAGCGLYNWAYQYIIDDTMAAEFPQEDLGKFGVYKEDVTLTNPHPSDYLGCHDPYLEVEEAPPVPQTLYTILTANMTLTLTDNNIAELYAMGNSVITVNISGTSKLNLYLLNDAQATVTAQHNSVLCFKTTDSSILQITANDGTVTHGETRGISNVSYVGNDTTHAKVKTWTKSVFSFVTDVGADVSFEKHNKSIVNQGFLP